MSFNGVEIPKEGSKIELIQGQLKVPSNPIIPFIEGDGTGRDIWKAAVRVFDAAVEKAFAGDRKVCWYEIFAGEKGPWQVWGVATQRHPGCDQDLSGGHQGTPDHPGRRRYSKPERHPSPSVESLCLRTSGEVLCRRAVSGQGTREDERGDLPGEYRRCLCRHRVAAGQPGKRPGSSSFWARTWERRSGAIRASASSPSPSRGPAIWSAAPSAMPSGTGARW